MTIPPSSMHREPASGTVKVGGLDLHYLDWGAPAGAAPGEALPLVLLQGLGGAAGEWRRVAEHFRSRYRVIALDQRGLGDSDHSPQHAYATDDFVADLEAFADALGLARFVLCGHSMGGHNAIAFTARHPDRVACALANDIPPALERDPEEIAKGFPGGQQPVFASIEVYVASRRASSPLTPEPMLRLAAETRLRRVEGGYQAKADANLSIHWAPADLWQEARTITRPIFFVRAGRSDVLDAATLQRMDMAIGPARSITLEQSGHSTYLDMEPEFLAVASQFFAAHTR